MTLPRREFLLLAKTLKLDKHDLTGWYCSEKLDGTRAFWDGGLSRGHPTKSVPWANNLHPKTGELKKKIKPVSTGLWSRYGNPIMAPDWFLNQLPCCPLDGELWAGRKNFQLCRSICAGDNPDERFDQLQFAVFDSPPLSAIFRDGEIKNASFAAKFSTAKIKNWLRLRAQDSNLDDVEAINDATMPFVDRLAWLKDKIPEEGRLFLVDQYVLGGNWRQQIEIQLQETLDDGGEGLMFRDPAGLWEPRRLVTSLKYKPFEDTEARIVGAIAGQEGRKGQVLGKIGALRCEVRIRPSREYVTFNIGSGFTMEQRELDPKLADWASENPGQEIPVYDIACNSQWRLDCEKLNSVFSLGDTITFKYRELSDDGIPKEPRFWRLFNQV